LKPASSRNSKVNQTQNKPVPAIDLKKIAPENEKRLNPNLAF
jgi:hypothetical protein